VTVSAILGVGLGVSAGIALDRNRYEDPLGLDAPMVNQPCAANKALLVLVSTDAPDRLSAELAAHEDARYLRTTQSCDTAWREAGKPAEPYAAYLGPFSMKVACEMQMTGNYRGAHVTKLTSPSPDPVQCLCHLAWQGMPTLSVGQTMSDRDSDRDVVYLHSLQELLTAMGRRPDIPKTDAYDPKTRSEVRRFQQLAGRPQTGQTDERTWEALLKRGCERL
jgi:Putative peptidoglycan binding domain